MNLTPKLARRIADRYEGSRDWTGKSEIERALDEVSRRHGGLFSVLTEDARRDLILTLGDNRRAANAYTARQRGKRETAQIPAAAE